MSAIAKPALFAPALAIVLAIEGVFSEDARDPGGTTKYGISQRAYPKLNVRELTQDQAAEIYRTDYWLRNACDRMPWWAALSVFDASVNQGPRPAAGLIQQAVGVHQDQIVGSQTLRAIASCDPLDGLSAFQTLRAYRYLNTVGFETFGRGWLRRLMRISAQAFQEPPP